MSTTIPKILLEDYIRLTIESQNHPEVMQKRNELETFIRKDWLDRFTPEQNKEFRYYADTKYFKKT